ncbi:MAG: hypothetical protein WC774_02280 [Candidatus Gracilibacteria bacterium]
MKIKLTFRKVILVLFLLFVGLTIYLSNTVTKEIEIGQFHLFKHLKSVSICNMKTWKCNDGNIRSGKIIDGRFYLTYFYPYLKKEFKETGDINYSVQEGLTQTIIGTGTISEIYLQKDKIPYFLILDKQDGSVIAINKDYIGINKPIGSNELAILKELDNSSAVDLGKISFTSLYSEGYNHETDENLLKAYEEIKRP